MNVYIRAILVSLLVLTGLNAAPARGGLITFTQPDGTTFEGLLKGDSSFHWIQSGQNIVLYNSKDKFYYNAKVDENGNLVVGKIKPSRSSTMQRAVSVHSNESNDSISDTLKNALKKERKESRQGSHPR